MSLSNHRLDSLTSCKSLVFMFLSLQCINEVPEIELHLASVILFTVILIVRATDVVWDRIGLSSFLKKKIVLSGEDFL